MPRSRLPLFAGLVALALSGLCAPATAQEKGRPGAFDYYTLVLSWSPTYCDLEGERRRDPQCREERDHGFVLHGLWPQFERGWPIDCYSGRRPWIDQDVIEDVLDIMPSKSLAIHEYAAHGTCSGLPPDAYYGLSRRLFEKIAIPPALRSPQADILSSPAAVEKAFIEANDWLQQDMISISCRSRDLLDVRICFDREGAPRACGPNESQRQLCPLPAIGIPAP